MPGRRSEISRRSVRKIGAVPIGAVMSDFAAEDGPSRFHDNQIITVAGSIESFRTRTTKNNTLMSYIQLEDDTGSMELMAFQKALDAGGGYIQNNAAVIVRGRISVRDEKEPQLMVDTIRPISDVNALGTQAPPPKEKKLWVRLPSRYDPAMKRIELILTMFPGDGQLILWCEREQKRIGARCLLHEGLILELEEMLGKENVVLK